MNILAHIHGYPPNHNAGAEWMVHHMFKWLKSHGHEITVSVPDPGTTEFEGIQIVPEYEREHIRKKYLRADIIISHLDRCGKVINNIRVVDKPACFIMHNTHRYSNIANIAHRSVLCFNSEYTRDVPYYTGRDNCIVYPPCPIDYYRTNRGGAKFVTIINHCLQKGSEMFYTLAKMLPNVQFMAIRGDYYHQEKERLPNVVFKENTPKIQKQYALTKILLMPSKYESFGRTAIEAAASGIPTISSPAPGLKESLGEAGIFHELDDAEGWAGEITKLLEDKEYYKKQAELSRKRAKQLEGMFESQMIDMVKLMQTAIDRKYRQPRE